MFLLDGPMFQRTFQMKTNVFLEVSIPFQSWTAAYAIDRYREF